MNSYRFLEGPPPESVRFSFTETLFNQARHRALQTEEGWHSFFIVRENLVVASIYFYVAGDVASSPLKAPYGSVEAAGDLDGKLLADFFAFMDDRLKRLGVRSATIKLRPPVYDSNLSDRTFDGLRKNGYNIISDEPQSIIPVNDQPFSKLISHAERKRLRKCREASFAFKQSTDHVGVYKLIEKWRAAKGFNISLALPDFKRALQIFPEAYPSFCVSDGDRVIAAAITIVVNDHILYDFAHDHDPQYNSFSPVVLLVNGIYEYCQGRAMSLLDLGTSISGDNTKQSLVKFKERLGANAVRKIVVNKIL